jgi:hypothetical protein
MIGRVRRPRDPFWDEGKGARRTQRRLRVEGLIAVALAIVACGVIAALWLRTLAPLVDGVILR